LELEREEREGIKGKSVLTGQQVDYIYMIIAVSSSPLALSLSLSLSPPIKMYFFSCPIRNVLLFFSNQKCVSFFPIKNRKLVSSIWKISRNVCLGKKQDI
jgi:hypothetical protein